LSAKAKLNSIEENFITAIKDEKVEEFNEIEQEIKNYGYEVAT
jgi:N-acetyl-anhydromuramyl-L-alanine amidase AmpD